MKKILRILFIASLAVLAVVSVTLLFPAFHKYKNMEARHYEVKSGLEREKGKALTLKQNLNSLENSSQGIEKIAREKFNYCKDNETVYKFKKETED